MHIGLPLARRILVIAPHPDDESLGCGGIIALYVQSGATVEVLVVSDGAALEEPEGAHNDLAAARAHEMTAATAALGIHHVHQLALPDGHLAQHQTTIAHALRDRIATFQPELVLAPSPIDGHVDHTTVGHVILGLFRQMPGWRLAFYEVFAPLRFNWLVEITEVLEQKERAVRCYQRSLFGQPGLFWEAFRALNLVKSAVVHRHGFFEALWLLEAPPSDQEVLAWATYGFQPHDGEHSTLWSVKGIDELLFALQEKTAALTTAQQRGLSLEHENAILRAQVRAQTEVNGRLQHAMEQREQARPRDGDLGSTRDGGFLRHQLKRMFPVGSPGRARLRRLKRVLAQYTSKSPSE
jgi:N-acetylglucosamine malate deacetylase 1